MIVSNNAGAIKSEVGVIVWLCTKAEYFDEWINMNGTKSGEDRSHEIRSRRDSQEFEYVL